VVVNGVKNGAKKGARTKKWDHLRWAQIHYHTVLGHSVSNKQMKELSNGVTS
jgi:hypothetical protein